MKSNKRRDRLKYTLIIYSNDNDNNYNNNGNYNDSNATCTDNNTTTTINEKSNNNDNNKNYAKMIVNIIVNHVVLAMSMFPIA